MLLLSQLADGNEDRACDERPATCSHFPFEWKLTLNSKGAARDTELNPLLAPNSFWSTVLQPRLEIFQKAAVEQVPQSRCTTVSAAVTDRSERDLVKRSMNRHRLDNRRKAVPVVRSVR